MKIYHNPRCATSRKALDYLKDKGHDPEIVLYLNEKLSKNHLKQLLKKMNLKVTDIIRTNEAIYKQQYKDKKLTTDQWLEVLVENPKLIQRPIVVDGDRAVMARPVENLDKFL